MNKPDDFVNELLQQIHKRYKVISVDRSNMKNKQSSTYYLIHYNRKITPQKYLKLIKKNDGKIPIKNLYFFNDEYQTLVFVGLKKNNPLTLKKIKMFDYKSNKESRCNMWKVEAKYYRNFVNKLWMEYECNGVQLINDGVLDKSFDSKYLKVEEKLSNDIYNRVVENNIKTLNQKEIDDQLRLSYLYDEIEYLKEGRNYLVDEVMFIKEEIQEIKSVIKTSSQIISNFLTNFSNKISESASKVSNKSKKIIADFKQQIGNVTDRINEWEEELKNKKEKYFEAHTMRKHIIETDISVDISSLKAYEYLNDDQLKKPLYLGKECKIEYSLKSSEQKINIMEKIYPEWISDMKERSTNYLKEKGTNEFTKNKIYKYAPLRNNLQMDDFLGWMDCTHDMLYRPEMKEKYRNSPEFYVEGDRLEICSYKASDPIKRLQIWYRICPNHRLFKMKDKELLLDMLKSFEEALGISEEPGIYNVECSMKEIRAYKKNKQIISRPD